jgi:hypothetical protein
MLHFSRIALKIFCASLLFCVLLFFGLGVGSAYARTQPQNPLEGKNVLILHAFEANRPINVITDRGLRASLDSVPCLGRNRGTPISLNSWVSNEAPPNP